MTVFSKTDLIMGICENKDVLHIGATDSPYHIVKAKKNILLHQKLNLICKNLVGIDINVKSIEDLKNYGIDNIYYGNIEKNDFSFKFDHFDIIILADVIEHLNNPGYALKNIKQIMDKDTKLIITTPNVFRFSNLRTFLTGKEYVHSDHTFWPSFATLKTMLKNHNLKINDFTYCVSDEISSISSLTEKNVIFHNFK